jgi:SAM-dependent methyltransferase
MSVTGGVELQDAPSGDRQARALLSGGASQEAIYRMVERELHCRGALGGQLIDVGCGAGNLWRYLVRKGALLDDYIGIDAVKYPDFPRRSRFLQADFDLAPGQLPAQAGDIVVAIETIEHLENPRSFVRVLVGLAKPGGWIAITTPNQRSLASTICLLARGEFSQFQKTGLGGYPAHITALLPSDLVKIAEENLLTDVAIAYSDCGRIPFTNRNWPRPLGGSLFSDTVMLLARRPPT